MTEPAPQRHDDFRARILRSVDPQKPNLPAAPDDTLVLAIAPAASALAAARDAVRAFLRRLTVPEGAVCDVVLSLEEACKNAIRFSGSRCPIDVTVAADATDVSLEVRDHGVGFEPRPIDRAVPPDPLEIQGRGLFLMACLMDDVRVAYDRGTVVTMRKAMAP
jgi:anti-sigma regulatory factor (Ser/Thr protein kinase)